MRLSVGVIILVLCVISSCRDRVVCPAYQSTYILDDSVRQTFYSYLWKLDEKERQNFLAQEKAKDSIPGSVSRTPSAEYFAYVKPYVPPVEEVKKNQYGIVKYQPFWVKNLKLQTAPKVNVHAPVFDEEAFEEEGTFLADDFAAKDSLATNGDSTKVSIPLAAQSDSLKRQGPRFLYNYKINDQHNVEQMYYNKYFAELLIDKSPPPKTEAPSADVNLPDSLQTKKKVGGFFKNLFKGKKNKAAADSTNLNQNAVPDDTQTDTGDEGTEEEEGGGL